MAATSGSHPSAHSRCAPRAWRYRLVAWAAAVVFSAGPLQAQRPDSASDEAAVPPDSGPSGSASFFHVERWRPFEASVTHFSAYFTLHARTLDPVEGIWERQQDSTGGRRVLAIVRDARYDGYTFVAVQLPAVGSWVTRQDGGRIVFALRTAGSPDDFFPTFQLRYAGAQARINETATLDFDRLRVMSGRGRLTVWNRVR